MFCQGSDSKNKNYHLERQPLCSKTIVSSVSAERKLSPLTPGTTKTGQRGGIISTIFECSDCGHWRQFWYKKDGTGWRIQILQWVWRMGNWRNWLETDKSWKPELPAKTFPDRFLQIFQWVRTYVLSLPKKKRRPESRRTRIVSILCFLNCSTRWVKLNKLSDRHRLSCPSDLGTVWPVLVS